MRPHELETPLELVGALTPEQKLAVAHGLWQTAWELTEAGIRWREPLLAAEAVEAKVREVFLRVDT